METRVKILIFPHKAHTNKKGLCPIRVRITTEHDKTVITPGIWVNPDSWHEGKKCLVGRSTAVDDGNIALENVKGKIRTIIRELERNDKEITGEKIKQIYEGSHEVKPMLMDFVDSQVEQIRNYELKPKGTMSLNRFKKYLTFREKITAFLVSRNRTKMFVKELDNNFWKEFENWMADEGGLRPGRAFVNDKQSMPLSVDSRRSYLSILKTMGFRAVEAGLIIHNPYVKKTIPTENQSRPYLPKAMVNALERLELENNPRLRDVRDLFIFQCWTGLSFTDLMDLNTSDFVCLNGEPIMDVYADQTMFIFRGRRKTSEDMLTPVFPKTKELMLKFRNHPKRKGNKIVPELSNQNYNDYLKEIAVMAGVNFNHMRSEREKNAEISSGVARHTFATMMLNSRKVDVRMLANMMGHSTTAQAEHYARMLPSFIDEQSKDAYVNIIHNFE